MVENCTVQLFSANMEPISDVSAPFNAIPGQRGLWCHLEVIPPFDMILSINTEAKGLICIVKDADGNELARDEHFKNRHVRINDTLTIDIGAYTERFN